ncbi:MAG: ABC transporter permease, partial [Pyrinomonadaceae bacterium]|nr:ABC transporter permease [Pyrinomonadaceae bacterium]
MPNETDITKAALTSSARPRVAASVGVAVIVLFAIIAILADFIAPYDYAAQQRTQPSAPASRIRFTDDSGSFSLRPFFYPQRLTDPLFLIYEEDRSRPVPLTLFARGDGYRFLGLMETNVHLFGPSDAEARFNLLGTDSLGRDRFSRLVQGIRFSLIVAPLGVLLASFIGVFIGTISGYAARWLDTAMMGIADAILSLPTLVLMLAARAAFPLELPPATAGFLLVTIFAAFGWAEMARLTRSLVRSLREREFVLAARSIGLSPARILFRHILPNAAGPIMTQATIMLPTFLLAEVSLSFLGVGLQEPVPSLGNMLAAAGDITQLSRQPLLLLSPAIAIFL